ncbi:MAG: SMP-30/gluconolactonase/LRE family protein [Alphaproteobacteria bacterium]|jgi:gluconolactonase|nr:SMP-30/gluconolactonase/LRE family protein [Alphaproteobacteria bacterium]
METLATGYGLIEGPLWDASRGMIYADVINGGAYCLAPDGGISQVIEHRRGIGGMSLHENGGIVVSGRSIALKPAGGGGTVMLLPDDPEGGRIGFNDITTDAKGRIYAGGLAFSPVGHDEEPKPGELYCIDLDGSARVVGQDVMLTNGLGFSPDGGKLYHSESLRNLVRVYDVAANGDLSPHRSFATVRSGIPDGLAVAVDGSVWVAIAHGSRVDVFEPDGSLRRSIPCDLPMVTSVCFGGDDLKDFYIVTGSGGTDRDDAGTVYRMRADVAGLPLAPAAVAC